MTGLVERPDDRMKRAQHELVGARVKARVPLLELVEYLIGEL
jgi:hypothetical protein